MFYLAAFTQIIPNTIIREAYHSFFIKYVYIYMTRLKLSHTYIYIYFFFFPTLFTNLTTIIIKINSNGRKNSDMFRKICLHHQVIKTIFVRIIMDVTSLNVKAFHSIPNDKSDFISYINTK